ncbi:hypothetical protein L1987_71629 [Smallanthus sonchifolius]|uniref:Uncharacterized protein n=1 Tax=Smallanthus sonchifolius TaxID=185202 RepID=A0ACB9AUL1_9ASTR|nr:hypothetical protein L1987_71629 [Smallanthus sonchifolius]
MAASLPGEPNSLPQNSDRYLIQHRSPSHSADDDFTISQLIRPNNSPPNPPPPSPLTSSLGKRRKSKPVRYDVYTTIGQKSRLQHNTVVEDSSGKSLSSQKGNSASKHVKSKVKSPPAMIKAGELQASLGTENPSCIKIVKANIDSAYWMGFPMWFGKLFLPKTDCEMVIEDENGEIHHIKYIPQSAGLSAGWKKFAVGHNLVEGDVLVFHLVESHKFKVYIIRANDLNEVDGALSLLNSEAPTKHMTSETETPSPSTKKYKRAKSLSSTMAQKEHKLSTPSSQIISIRKEQSGNNSEEIGSEVLEEELKKLKESSRKIQSVVEGLKEKVGSCEVKFQEEVNAPW